MRLPSGMGTRRDWRHPAGLLAALLLLAGGGEGWAGEVTLRAPTALLTTLPTKVTVTLTPSPSPEPVVLALPVRSWRGPGEAVFLPGRERQVILMRTTTVEVLGTVLSEQDSNVLLAVTTLEGELLASHLFTVVDYRMLTREQAIDRARAALQPELATRPELTLIDYAIRLVGSEYRVSFRTPFRPYQGQPVPYVQRWVTVDAITGAVKRIGERPE